MKLTLYFDNHSLWEITFEAPMLNKVRRSIRGKNVYGSIEGNFPWSSAVKALCLLVIGEFINRQTDPRTPFLLTGGLKSPASTLDFALDKEPTWMKDVFGVDRNNVSLIRKLIQRVNPRQRKNEELVISFREHANQALEIDLRTSFGKRAIDKDEASALYDEIESSFSRKGRAEQLVRPQQLIALGGEIKSTKEENGYECPIGMLVDEVPWLFANEQSRALIKEEFNREVSGALFRTEMFSRRQVFNSKLAELHCHPHFVHLAGRGKSVVSEIDQDISFPERLGVVVPEDIFQHLRRSEPFTIAVGPGGITTIIIFLFMQRVRGLNVRVEYRFPNSQNLTSEICNRTFSRRAEGVILSPACAARVVNSRTEFSPLMIMPGTSNRIIGGRSVNVINGDGQFVFMTDSPSSSTFYYHDLVDNKVVRNCKKTALQVEPDEVISHMQDPSSDTKAILWWPYYMFQTKFGIAKDLDYRKDNWIYYMTTLFVHNSVIKDRQRARALDIAIRDAWLALRSSPRMIDVMIDELLSDPQYTNCLFRFNGLHNLTPSSFNQIASCG
jgi:hypothetical protein